MIERHRESQGFWGKCTAVLVVLGLAIAGYGLTAAVGWHSGLFWLGLFVAAAGVFPLAEMLERKDRAKGLETLRREWQSMANAADTTPAEFDRLSMLIRQTHG